MKTAIALCDCVVPVTIKLTHRRALRPRRHNRRFDRRTLGCFGRRFRVCYGGPAVTGRLLDSRRRHHGDDVVRRLRVGNNSLLFYRRRGPDIVIILEERKNLVMAGAAKMLSTLGTK